MRELTDRELDAVCGGLLNFFTFQNITNHQSNSSATGAGRRRNFVGQRRGCHTGERRNQHELQLVWYRTLLRSGGGVCFLGWVVRHKSFKVCAMASNQRAQSTRRVGAVGLASRCWTSQMRRATTIGDERSPAPMAIPVSSPILRAVRRRKVLPPPQQVEGPSSSSPTSLFRHEVVDFQEIERQFGRAILLQPISLKVITWLLASVVALIFLFWSLVSIPARLL